ncbi:rCG60682, isoform CRA_a [Rattus norvegicus]|uniref:RCG60682, isoform CRA_a n=1 Tax=Rattus norvegicus TaxID=10116 RepID=A6JJY8_RAT|nr:rCG60682, isoform CRA_a [Rattus norvegicus]
MFLTPCLQLAPLPLCYDGFWKLRYTPPRNYKSPGPSCWGRKGRSTVPAKGGTCLCGRDLQTTLPGRLEPSLGGG